MWKKKRIKRGSQERKSDGYAQCIIDERGEDSLMGARA